MPCRSPLPLRVTLLALALAAAGCGPDEAAPAPAAAGPTAPVTDGSAPPDDVSDELLAQPHAKGPGRPPGRWLPVRDALADEAGRDARIAELEAIGYVAGSRAAQGAGGVRALDPARVQPGLNLLVSGHAPEAVLLDASGRLLHAWSRSCREAFPALKAADAPRYHFFRRAHLLEDGSLLAIFEGAGLVKLAPDSTLLWAWPGRAHHDLEVRSDGRILTLSRTAHVVPRLVPDRPLVEDFVVELSPEGEELRAVSLLEALEAAEGTRAVAARANAALEAWNGDVFHANSVQWLSAGLAGAWPLAHAGDVLLSLRNVDMLALLDLREQRFAWSRTGAWRGQHQPELQPDGRLLLFDNACGSPRSRVLELDPATCAVTWSWSGTEADPLWSETCGSVQGLANGNVLVVESDGGRAFEVARDGTLVWRLDSPFRAGERGEFVATLFDCVRLPAHATAGWLK